MVQIPNKDKTILNYYVLPLIELSINKLPDFEQIYLNYTGDLVFIKFTTKPKLAYSEFLTTTITYKDAYYQVYAIPDKFLNDMRYLLKGKYSKMSLQAKATIIENSGLNYMVKNKITGKFNTASALLALDKRPELRSFMEKKLSRKSAMDVHIEPNSDLMDKLTNDVFIDNIFEEQ